MISLDAFDCRITFVQEDTAGSWLIAVLYNDLEYKGSLNSEVPMMFPFVVPSIWHEKNIRELLQDLAGIIPCHPSIKLVFKHEVYGFKYNTLTLIATWAAPSIEELVRANKKLTMRIDTLWSLLQRSSIGLA